MAGVIACSFVFLALLHSGFTEQLECIESTLGTIALHRANDNGNDQEQGTVVVCIKNGTGNKYTRAAFCFGEDWTFNVAAGNAACRQAGYVSAINVDSNVKLGTGSPDVGAVFTNIQCPVDKSYVSEGEINLLRCSHEEPTYNKTPNCNLAAVKCDTTHLYKGDPYNGQVYIDYKNDPDYLYINYSGEARPVCAEGYTNATLNSICQQMGYTEAWPEPMTQTFQPINPANAPKKFWNLGNVSCDHGPYPCFTDCFKDKGIDSVPQCPTRLSLKCIYNESNAAVAGSGNKGICAILELDEDDSWSLNSAGILLLVLLPVVIGSFIVYICFLAHHGKEKGWRKFWPWCCGKNKESNNHQAPGTNHRAAHKNGDKKLERSSSNSPLLPKNREATDENGGEKLQRSSSNPHLPVKPEGSESGSLSVSLENGEDRN